MAMLRHAVRYQLPAVLWAIVIFVASSIPATKLPRFSMMFNDKLVHAAIFFIFGLLVYRALTSRSAPDRFDWTRLFISVSAVIIYGLSDEIHQGFVPGRTVDVLDAMADAAGGLLAAGVIYFNLRRKRPVE